MKRKLIYRREAVAELAKTKAYTTRTWGDAQATRYIAALVADIKALRLSANRYPLFSEVYPELRRKRSGMHHIYYLASQDRVEIVRIMHVSRDPGRHLKLETWRDEGEE
jgi:toxin ParE1/3/4